MSAALPELLVCQALLGELDRGRPTVVAAVVSHTDGSPGRTGWIMAVGQDGWLAGTVGGGAAEETAVRRSLALLDAGAARTVRLTQTHRPDAEHASGLLCGGEQLLALAPLADASRHGLRAAIDALERGERFTWSPAEDVSVMLGPTHRVVVVGAGHVGQALAPLLVRLGFRVDVIDERAGAAARLQGAAHAVHTLAYEDLADVVPPGEDTFVVVATPRPTGTWQPWPHWQGLHSPTWGYWAPRRNWPTFPVVPSWRCPRGSPSAATPRTRSRSAWRPGWSPCAVMRSPGCPTENAKSADTGARPQPSPWACGS